MTDANDVLRQAHEEIGRLHALIVDKQREIFDLRSWRYATATQLGTIIATLRNCPEPIVNAMMETRVREARGLHMADQIRAMLLVFADALESGAYLEREASDAV